MADKNENVGTISICIVIVLVALASAALNGFVWLKPTSTLVGSAPQIFGSLLLVSLFVERMIEVFVSIWADDDTDLTEQQLDYWQRRQQQLAKALADLRSQRITTTDAAAQTAIDIRILAVQTDLDGAATKINDAQQSLIPFRAHTRRISTWAGLALGTLTSAVGFRLLNQIVEIPQGFDKTWQCQCFLFVDVLLTGAVLSGGSQTVHQIFSLYESFMNAGQRKTKNSGE